MMDTLYKESVRAFRSGNYDGIDAMVKTLRRDGSAELFARLLEGCCIEGEEGFLPSAALVSKRFRQPAADYAALQLIGYAPDPSLLDPSIDRSRITELCIQDHSLNARHQFRMKRFPDGIFQMNNLGILNLSEARLERLPEGFGRLSSLSMLDLSANLLQELPLSIGKLRSLSRLYLSGNRLRSLPDTLSKLGRLEYLHLGSNCLTTFPKSLTGLKNLYKLDISGNDIRELPEEIRLLKRLTILDLSRNRDLRTIPSGLADLPSLESLMLGGVAKPIPRPASTLLRENALHEYLNKVRRRYRLPQIQIPGPADDEDTEPADSFDMPDHAHRTVPQGLRNLQPLLFHNACTTEKLGLQLLKTLGNRELVAFLLELYEVRRGIPHFRYDNPYGIHLHEEKSMRLLNGILSTFDTLPIVPDFDPRDIREVEISKEDSDHPGLLGKLTGLTSLKISLQDISLPRELHRCRELRQLRIDGLPADCDPDLSELPELRALWLSIVRGRKCLTIGGLPLVEDIHMDRVRSRLIEISGMPSLRSLTIRMSSAVSLIISGCPALTEITLENMYHLQVLALPGTPGISKVQVRCTKPGPVLDAIGGMASLGELEMEGMKLTGLPDAILSMKGLRRLSLSYNHITRLPWGMDDLQGLEMLDLRANRVEEFPKVLLSMPGLQTLDLSRNLIRELPETLTGLSGIRNLLVGENLLTALPESLADLPMLRNLNLGSQRGRRFSYLDLPSGLFGRDHPVLISLDCDRLTQRMLDARFRADTQRMQRSSRIGEN